MARTAAARRVIESMGRFSRVEILTLKGKDGREATLERFAAKRLRRALRGLSRLPVSIEGLSDARLHGLRKACRRARYRAEFAEPVVKDGEAIVAELRALTGILGRARDLRMNAARIARRSGPAMRRLERLMNRERRRELERFERAWARVRRRIA
jgi:CHAD domain-containing protein